MYVETSPDMIWYTCEDCERNFTLADMDGNRCPWCESLGWVPYTDE